MLRTIGNAITTSGLNIYAGSGGTLCTIPSDATQTRMCKAYITLTGLSTVGGTYTISLLANGTTYIVGSPADLDLSSTLGVTTYKFWTDDFIIPVGETFAIKLKSPNSADTSITSVTTVYESVPTYIPTSRPSGQATNIEDMIVQIWSRFFGKVVLDKDADTLTTYNFTDASPATVQNVTVVGNVETVDKAETP